MKSRLEKVLDIIQHEPNYENFEYKGYYCVIKRMLYLGGQLNGYVRIPENHPVYDQKPHDIEIECHGGITFGPSELEGETGIFIGFDTAHYRDYMPFMIMLSYTQLKNMDEGTYKDINYVRNECKQIVEQLLLKK